VVEEHFGRKLSEDWQASVTGVQAALSAGMKAIAYAGGVTPGEWLAIPGVTVIDEMTELPGLLNATPTLDLSQNP
jgi:beta-phosphoglucomutase-like phosphatase (HAD superfamily)